MLHYKKTNLIVYIFRMFINQSAGFFPYKKFQIHIC